MFFFSSTFALNRFNKSSEIKPPKNFRISEKSCVKEIRLDNGVKEILTNLDFCVFYWDLIQNAKEYVIFRYNPKDSFSRTCTPVEFIKNPNINSISVLIPYGTNEFFIVAIDKDNKYSERSNSILITKSQEARIQETEVFFYKKYIWDQYNILPEERIHSPELYKYRFTGEIFFTVLFSSDDENALLGLKKNTGNWEAYVDGEKTPIIFEDVIWNKEFNEQVIYFVLNLNKLKEIPEEIEIRYNFKDRLGNSISGKIFISLRNSINIINKEFSLSPPMLSRDPSLQAAFEFPENPSYLYKKFDEEAEYYEKGKNFLKKGGSNYILE